MTIREAIDALAKIAAKYGDTTEVFFDCPRCLTAYTPTVAVTQAIHLAAKSAREAH